MKIDIVMPTKNSGGTIGRALDAMLSALAGRPFQLIIVDGGSTDDTLTVIQKKVRNAVILTENIGSQALAVNIGVKASKGQYVCFLDSDVIVPRNFFSKLLSYFTDPEIGAVEASLMTIPGSLIYDFGVSYMPLELKGSVVAEGASRACLIVRRKIMDFDVDSRLKVAEDIYLTQYIIGVKKKKIIRDNDVRCLHIRGFSVWGDFKRGMRYCYYQALDYYLLPKWLKYNHVLERERARAILYLMASLLVIPLPAIWLFRLRKHKEKKLKYGVIGWLFRLGNRVGLLLGFLRWARTEEPTFVRG
jgi:glycosyltransferase involved in cell wall biosynthesis